MATPANSGYGTGRRKTAVARVRLTLGTGQVTVNEKSLADYLARRTLQMVALQPLRVAASLKRFDISVKVVGGGTTGQAGAIGHGIARALVSYDETLRKILRDAGLMTRDARMKERKKYGLKRARKAPQYTKR